MCKFCVSKQLNLFIHSQIPVSLSCRIPSHSEFISLTSHILEKVDFGNIDLKWLIQIDLEELSCTHMLFICECFYIMCYGDLYCIYILIRCWLILNPRLLCCCGWNQWCQNVIILKLPLLNIISTNICAVVCTTALVWCVFWALKRKSASLAMLKTSAPRFLIFVPFMEFGVSDRGVMLFCDWWCVKQDNFSSLLSGGKLAEPLLEII